MSRGRNDADIISRLQFNGEGFSRDYKKLTAELAKYSKDAAQSATSSFVSIDRAAVEMMESTRRADAAVASFGKGVGVLKSALGTLGVGIGVAAIKELAFSAAENAKEITKLAQLSGVSADRFQALAYGARSAGIEADKLSDIFKDVNDKFGDFFQTGGGELKDFFDTIAPKVGVTAGEFRKLSGPDALQLYVTSLEKAKVSQADMTFYMEALANDATALVPVLRDGGRQLSILEQEFEDLGLSIDQNMIQRLTAAERTWDRTLLQMKNRATIFVAGTVELFQHLGDAMDRNRAEIILNNKNASEEAQQWAQDVLIDQQREGLDRLSALSRQFQAPASAAPARPEKPGKAGAGKTGTRARDAEAKAEKDIAEAYERQLVAAQRAIEIQEATLLGREAEVSLAHDLIDIEEKYADKISHDKIDALKAATTELAEQKRLAQEIKDLDSGAENALKVHKAAKKALEDQYREQAKIHEREFNNLADIYERAFRDGTGGIWDTFKSMGKRAIAEMLTMWTLGGKAPSGSMIGSLFGQDVGSAGSILDILGVGRKGASAPASVPGWGGIDVSWWPGATGGGASASAVGGLGSLAGQGFGGLAIGAGIGSIQKGIGLGGSSLGGAIGGAIGSFVPIPGGSIIGSVLGSTIGGLIGGGAKTSNATLTGMGTATTGGKGGKQDQALGLAGSVQDGLRQIADALGVDVGSFYTTIGLRGGDYRVNTSGTSLKTGKGARDFGDDAQAAIEYAIRDAIGDGAFSGRISAAAERALKQTGKSIEKAIEDALTIESIPRRLKEIEDPIGAALDAVNAEFTKLRDTLVANGASAQQLADAEKLYGYEREAALKRTESTLRDFLGSLKVGGNSPLSLRDQLGTAEADFARYEADIAAGKAVDQSGFAEAAQAALGIKRQTDGSTQGYFDLYNRVVAAGGTAQGRLDSAAANRTETNPFAKPTAEATAETANNTATLPAILAQLQQISAQLTNGGAGALVYGNFGFMR